MEMIKNIITAIGCDLLMRGAQTFCGVIDSLTKKDRKPQFRSIILCDLLLYIDVTFWYLSIDLGFFWGSWFLHRHKIPHPNPMGDMISTKKYCLFKEYFRVVGLICI